MAGRLALVWLVAGLCLAPGASAAQGLEVLVLDEGARPVEGAQGQIGELRALSGADGLIRFPELAPGRYRLITRYIGYRPDFRDLVIGGIEPARVTVRLNPAPLTLPPVVVEATRPGLYGIVSTNRLEPLPGAEVHLMGRRGRVLRADSAGHFMHPVAVGAYLVRFSAKGYQDLRLSVTVPKDGGRELLVHLPDARPGYQGASNREKLLFEALGFRLARANPRNVLTRAELERYRFASICDIPQVRTTVNEMERLGAEPLINGDFWVPNPCGVGAHQVQIIEWGPNVCARTAMGAAELFRGGNRGMPNASGQAGLVRRQAGRCPPYLVIWLTR